MQCAVTNDLNSHINELDRIDHEERALDRIKDDLVNDGLIPFSLWCAYTADYIGHTEDEHVLYTAVARLYHSMPQTVKDLVDVLRDNYDQPNGEGGYVVQDLVHFCVLNYHHMPISVTKAIQPYIDQAAKETREIERRALK